MSYALYAPEELRRAFARQDPDRQEKLRRALEAELAAPQDDPVACGHIKALLQAAKDGRARWVAQYDVDLSAEIEKSGEIEERAECEKSRESEEDTQ